MASQAADEASPTADAADSATEPSVGQVLIEAAVATAAAFVDIAVALIAVVVAIVGVCVDCVAIRI